MVVKQGTLFFRLACQHLFVSSVPVKKDISMIVVFFLVVGGKHLCLLYASRADCAFEFMSCTALHHLGFSRMILQLTRYRGFSFCVFLDLRILEK